MIDWIAMIEGAVTGGALVAVATLPSAIKKARAEAKASEIENMQRVADGWKQLAEERQEANAEKDARIAELTRQVDDRYADIGNWRDKYNQKCEEITELKVKRATDEVKLCIIRGCEHRDPPSGY